MWLVVELVLGPLWFTSRKKCESDHETRDSQKAYFQAYGVHSHGPKDFAVGEAKEVLSLQMLGDHGKEMLFIYKYKSISTKCFHSYKERKREGQHEEILKTTLFDIYLKEKKPNAFIF